MRRGVVFGTLVVAGLLAGPAQARQGCSRIDVGSTPETRGRGFSTKKVLDLNFTVFIPGASRRDPVPASLEVKVFTPNGHLYQAMTVPVAIEDSKERQRKVKGYHFPRKTSRARGHQDGRALRRVVDVPPFPVAGTSIVTSSLYGLWRVEAWPEGANSPCEASFEIRQ